MKTIFRAVFYLRSNYVNKEGKTPVMLRIYLNNERLSIGSTGIAVQQSQWDREKERLKGRTTEALSTNLELDNIQSGLQTIFKKVEMTDEVSLERIKSEYLGKKEDVDTLMSLFNKHNSDVARQVACRSKLQPYRNTTSARNTFQISFVLNTVGLTYACQNSPILSYTTLIFIFERCRAESQHRHKDDENLQDDYHSGQETWCPAP